MRTDFLPDAERYLKTRRKRKRWYQVLSGLAAVVVFCTVYALILPAITMEKPCPLPEHSHSDSCYRQITVTAQTVPTCSMELHQHSEACYNETGQLICGYADLVVHQHDDRCYNEDGTLWCPLEEHSEHQHEDSCYAKVHQHTPDCYRQVPDFEQLLCTEHEHSDSCWDETSVLICEESESENKHQHDETCWDENNSLICEQGENSESENSHQHGDTCRETQSVLVCGYDSQHQHDDSCYASTDELICDYNNETNSQETVDAETESENESETAEKEDENSENTLGELLCEQAEICLHEHDEGCFDEQGTLTCEKVQILAHQHDDSCFVTEESPVDTSTLTCTNSGAEHEHGPRCYGSWELICQLAEHTHDETCSPSHITYLCGKVQHLHDASCQNEAGELICGKEEHEHTLLCPSVSGAAIYLCSQEQHQHDDSCKNENGELICGKEEHLHLLRCVAEEDDCFRIENVIALIDAMPDEEALSTQLAAVEDDEEAYNALFAELALHARTVYAYYEDLGAELQRFISNRDKLMNQSWLWSAETLEVKDSISVYQVNAYKDALTTMIHSKTVGEWKLGMHFTNWDAIYVEKHTDGKLYVKEYEKKGKEKDDSPVPEGGFILLIYDTTVNVSVGDEVLVDFDYLKAEGAQTSKAYGTVSFGSNLKPKEEKSNDVTELELKHLADTRNWIEINLYDYGDNINEPYKQNKNLPGFQQENGTTGLSASTSSLISGHFNFGNNITADLAAGINGVTNGNNKPSPINTVTYAANRPTSNAMKSTLGADGYPVLKSGESLAYLFGGEYNGTTYAQKMNSQSVNYLFKYDDHTGEYSFNSRENHAQFNSADDTFSIYNEIITPNFMMYPFGNFMPFNDIVHDSAQSSTINRAYLQSIADSALVKYYNNHQSEYQTLSTQLNQFIRLMGNNFTAADCINGYFGKELPNVTKFTDDDLSHIYTIDYDEPTDFYFGMEIKMKFMQPKDGLTGKNRDLPMQFFFTGDDDVWVYIDNTLFLDLSGVHRHVGGMIDFEKGRVYYYELDPAIGDVNIQKPYKTVKFSELVDSSLLNSQGTFEDYSQHSFNFYYMERGSGSGVCRMNFNFPILKDNTISIGKELSVNGNDSLASLLGNPDFYFQVWKEGGKELYIPAGTEYEILNFNGSVIGQGVTDEHGIITLKANQVATFPVPENQGDFFVRELLDPAVFAQYGEITVGGQSTTTDHNVTVGSNTFTGVNSPLTDISDGSTLFRFDNQVDLKKLGTLDITKTLTGTPTSDKFTFKVCMDGTPLPVNSTYLVGSETRTVSTEGLIELAPNETASISNVIAGTQFTVQEQTASSLGYIASYYVDGTYEGHTQADGTIAVESHVKVVVNNTLGGTDLTIPVQKTLLSPDGETHSYDIQLVQVSDQSGTQEVEKGEKQSLTFELTTEPVNKTFTLSYPKIPPEETQTYYYKVSEIAKADDTLTIYDSGSYVLQVQVSNVNGAAIASIVSVWKDGNPFTLSNESPLAFTNQIRRYELPSTGGSGTLCYTTGGTLLLITAAALLLYRYKRSKQII